MNVRKRGLALLMCICMVFTLLPFSAFADGTSDKSVIYGTYDKSGTTWTQDDKATDTVTKTVDNQGNTVTLKKMATPTGNENEYKIDLEVITTETSSTKAGDAATVLVIDVSGSMGDCATCGNEKGVAHKIAYGHAFESRIAAAQAAAKQFIDAFKSGNARRYVSVVSFSTESRVACEWKDVSTVTGYKAVKDAIDGLEAKGGTNLDAGLQTANTQLSKTTVASIKANAKNVIALTDGMPTFYVGGDGKNGNHGSTGCPITNDKTAASATALKNSAALYTVCFGASNDKCWSDWDYNERNNTYEYYASLFDKISCSDRRHAQDGPTVGDFLKNSIATQATNDKTYAYNADNTKALLKAFKDITDTITEGISAGTVKDGLPIGVSFVGDAPTAFVENADGTYSWELIPENAKKGTDGEKTTYTYTVSYVVTLDTTDPEFNEGIYHALNTETTFTAGGKVYNFNVPGVKGTAPRYNVTYKFEGTCPDSVAVPASEQHKAGDTVTMPEITAPEGWIFNGWKYYSNTVTNVEMPASDITIIGTFTERKAYTVKYLLNGTDISVKDADTGTKNVGESVEATAPDLPGYTFAGTDADKNQTITVASDVSQNVITFYYYKNVTVTAKNDTKVYGNDDSAAFGATVTGTRDNETVVYTVGRQAGEDVGNYAITPTGDKIQGYYKVEYKTGSFEITARPVTLTGESDTRTYTGQEIELTNIEQSGLLDGHTFSGVRYSAKGTDARTEPYPGTFSNTENIVIKDAAGNDVTHNYNVKYKPGALTINPIGTVTVTIKGNHDSKVYNGAEQSVEGYTVVSISDINYKDTDFSLKVGVEAKATGTNASDTAYPMGLTADSFVNNNKNFKNVTFVVEEDGSLTITKRPLTIEGQSSEPITYDGQTHSFMDWWPVTATDNTGLVSGHEVSGISYLLTGKDADSYTGEFTGTAKVMAGEVDVTGNYDIEYALGEMLIEPAEKIVIKITGNTATETYDGTEKSVTGYTADVKDSSITVKLKEGKAATAKGTDVGKYMMGLEAEDFVVSSTNNYKEIAIVVEDGYLDITPITDKVVVTITGHKDEFTYDGKEHTVNGYDTNISNQLYKATDFTFTGKAEVSRTEVGTSDMGLKNDQFQNVSKNFTNVKFVINDGGITIKERPYRPNPSITDKITVEITGNSDSVVYDGTEHSVKDYTVKISDSRYTEKDFTFSGKALASGVNAGTYEMGLKADQFKNTNARFKNVEFIIKADGVLTITQRPLTITAGSAEGIAPVTCDKYTVEGLATGDKVDSVKLTGIQSEPGESPNVASDAVIKNAKGEDVTANYKITYVDGVLKAIEVLNKEIHFNYVIGYTDGTIRPNNDISRAEVATIFFRLLTDEAREQYTTTAGNFTDVKAGMWCNRAIATLTNMGIIKGYTDGSFQPNKSITRAELATIIARFAKLDVNTKTFSDINGHWAQKNIELAAGNGWINGYEDGTFRPNNNITRAETFAMINRVLDRQTESVSDLLPTSDMNMWSDNMNENAWYYKDVQEATNYHKCDRVGDSVYEKWTEKVPDIDWASYQI